MLGQFSRTAMLLGKDSINALNDKRVIIFGIGGVGGSALEALTRSGVGNIDIVDDDKVCLTNINRQLFALISTVGKYKVDVAKERMLDINPRVNINTFKTFFLKENKDEFDFSKYDFIIDCIDTVTGKLSLIEEANRLGVPIISAMGAGNKLHPELFEITDIKNTSVDPLARVMRYECRKRGIKKLTVVYSKEKPIKPIEDMALSCRYHCICPPGAKHKCTDRRDIPVSVSFVPPVVGYLIASHVIISLTSNLS